MLQPSQGKKIPRKLVVFFAVCVAIYAAWNIAYPSGSWRYKLTVEVETPEGIKTGSTVREVHARMEPALLPDMRGVSYSIKGEAVVVDLGDRGQVFALLPTYRDGSDGWRNIVFRAFPTKLKRGARINYYQSLTGQSKLLDAGEYPVLVRFRDPQDPKTVEKLSDVGACSKDNQSSLPVSFCLKNDRFIEAFGEGVKLKSVVIQMTREPVTKGVVEKYLPWIFSIKSNLDGTSVTMSHELSNNLNQGSFIRVYK